MPVRQAFEDVFEIGVGLDLVELCRFDCKIAANSDPTRETI